MINNSGISNFLYKTIATIGEYSYFIFDVTRITFKHPPRYSLIQNQMFEYGVKSFVVVAITGFSTGFVLTVEAMFNLADKGLASGTGLVVTKAMLVEIGPVLTAFMLTGRVGSAMCAELATMKVTEQIAAMESMAVDPLQYLVAPRFIAVTFMLPILMIFSAAIGIGASYFLFVNYYNMEPTAFTDLLPANIKVFDFVTGLAKAFAFGIIIATVSCYMGMTTSGGAEGVGRSTTISVVFCYCFILIGNFFLTLALNNSYGIIEEVYDTMAEYIPWT